MQSEKMGATNSKMSAQSAWQIKIVHKYISKSGHHFSHIIIPPLVLSQRYYHRHRPYPRSFPRTVFLPPRIPFDFQSNQASNSRGIRDINKNDSSVPKRPSLRRCLKLPRFPRAYRLGFDGLVRSERTISFIRSSSCAFWR